MDQHIAIGRRKSSVARVYMRPGTGAIRINGQSFESFFGKRIGFEGVARQPFVETQTEGKYDLVINVKGGGTTGQVEAIRLGVARALEKANPAYRPTLKSEGLLTRDPREVERKKPGQPKARKRFQYSKR